jgi:sialidase-1
MVMMKEIRSPWLMLACLVIISACAAPPEPPPVTGKSLEVFVAEGRALGVRQVGKPWEQKDGYLEGSGKDNYLFAGKMLADSDFHVRIRLGLQKPGKTSASFVFCGNHFGFDAYSEEPGKAGKLFVEGPLFGRTIYLDDGLRYITPGESFVFEAVREGTTLTFRIDGKEVYTTGLPRVLKGPFGLRPWRGAFRIYEFTCAGYLEPFKPFNSVFVSGEDGYHTYRIPALVVTNKGTLLAFCEGRKTGRADHGDIDLLVKRSFDNGRIWTPQQVVYEEGGTSKITIGNPAPVVDRFTGTVWLAFCRENKDVFITHSVDDGATWTKPKNITRAVKDRDWSWYATGPGNGIQLRRGAHKGRLLIPCDHYLGGGQRDWKARGRSHVIYSDDHGETWQAGEATTNAMNECTAVELEDGRVMLNMRCYRGKHRRAVALSGDGGLTWSDCKDDETLVEPVCQASILRYSWKEEHGKSRILFSNPAHTTRNKMTVRVSYDEGKTWPKSRRVYLGPSAYSNLARLENGEIGLLFEAGFAHPYEHIAFERFGLDWLTDGKDR